MSSILLVIQNITLVLVAIYLVDANQDEAFCRAENGSLGFCINLKSQIKHCSELRTWLKTGDDESFAKLRNSLCSRTLTEEDARVCCPIKKYNEARKDNLEKLGFYSMHKNFKLLPLQAECGTVGSADRIIGGQSAKPGDFPWVVRIGHRESGDTEPFFSCSGTVINQRYILTAAHCFSKGKKQDSTIVVRLGDTDDSIDPESITIDGSIILATSKYVDAEAEEIVIHEKYLGDSDQPNANDIALIRLKNDVNISSPFFRPVCLPFLKEYHLPKALRDYNLVGRRAFIAGWGKTNSSENVGSTALQYLRVEIQSNIYCRIVYQRNFNVTNEQLCAGGEQGKNACLGDSGGPLTTMSIAIDPATKARTERSYQLGIISFGKNVCAGENHPTVYTKVRSYLSWILDNIKE